MRLQVRLWFEWVDSKATPADSLSRLGLDCPSSGRLAYEADQPKWQFEPDFDARLAMVASAPLASLTYEGL